jgi:hypothetical protein
MRVNTALTIAVISSMLSFACKSPMDKKDENKAKEDQRDYDKLVDETMKRAATLKGYIRSAFTTTNYIWVYAPSKTKCSRSYESDPKPDRGNGISMPSTEAKRELASEKKLNDPSLFDGSKEAILCAGKK